MRLGAGSSILGLGGMRPVRRFGMALGKSEGAGESHYGWFGHGGLERWIVRPLLDVSKVRERETKRARLLFFFLVFAWMND